MRSRAHIRGDPIHPMLVHFPIAFLLGAFVFDAAGVLLARPSWWEVGGWLAVAGLVMGVVAAMPGLIDYLYTVPPASSGRRRATKHMIVNIVVLVLFGIATFLRGDAAVSPEPVLLMVEGIASGLLIWSASMGGTLVVRNQIGVDHRYADAGKWNEASLTVWTDPLARADELEPGQMKLVRVAGRRIVVARTDSGWHAFDDRCPHRGGSLAGGSLACGVVQCPWHGSQFDVRDGSLQAGPSEQGIAVYEVEERDGAIRLTSPVQ